MTIEAVKDYIKQTWHPLTRSHRDIVTAAKDSKIDHTPGTPWRVYVSASENQQEVVQSLQSLLSPEAWEQIEVCTLPQRWEAIDEEGLLYLPYPYVVPGGKFNEQFGWDSYFTLLGLLRDGEVELAQNMVDNFIYEVEHYGAILNANRTYLLTRSQPPFLTRMVLAVFEQTQNHDWLASTLPSIDQTYEYWHTPEHLNAETGLSRYFDFSDQPAIEAIASEQDEQGRSHYERVQDYYRTHIITDYDLNLYYDAEHDCLKPLFYQGDRSMRESGFDVSNRFGAFNIDVLHYVPVCLNALLYQMEQDTAQIYEILEQPDRVTEWHHRAYYRQQRLDRYLWDEETGLYFDYNFRTCQRRHYEFATTFYPLWARLASPHQAQRVVANLSKFEAEGGILTSTHQTGNQWDTPFGWAPLQLMAVQGLHNYGYDQECQRIAQKFVTLVTQEFEKSGILFEKYDVRAGSAAVSEEIHFGYSSNETGFGWTNGVFLELLECCNK
jgi:alpha,alpha-trehalase